MSAARQICATPQAPIDKIWATLKAAFDASIILTNIANEGEFVSARDGHTLVRIPSLYVIAAQGWRDNAKKAGVI